jgi:hypothetical protein
MERSFEPDQQIRRKYAKELPPDIQLPTQGRRTGKDMGLDGTRVSPFSGEIRKLDRQ